MNDGVSKRGEASLFYYPLPFINTQGKGVRGIGHQMTFWRKGHRG
jgi:hypothetical protein